jgi:hypothetical protein
MTNKKWMIAALLATLSGAFSSNVSAQAAEEAAAAKEDGGSDEEASKHPMGWFGLGLTLGAGGVGSGQFEIDNPAYDSSGMLSGAGVSTGVDECPIDSPKCKVESESRTGFQLNLKLTFGGEGFGWDLDPYLNLASNGKAFGMYTGWKYDVHAMDPLYIGFGFGPKLAYVQSDKFDYGADVYGRGMVRGTYYLLNELGIVAELGLGYGASGYVALPTVDPATGNESSPKVSFGSSMTWDFSVGTRWP